jgi:excisionase family DNA binding protein
MSNSVCYSPKDFTIMADDNTLEFASPVIDSQGKRGSAQIKVLTDGTILKDSKERYSVDEKTVIWSSDIDKFVIEKVFSPSRSDKLREFIADQILTTKEVSKLLGVTRQQISNCVIQGKIEPIKKTRGGCWFTKTDIMRYLTEKGPKYQHLVKTVLEYRNS